MVMEPFEIWYLPGSLQICFDGQLSFSQAEQQSIKLTIEAKKTNVESNLNFYDGYRMSDTFKIPTCCVNNQKQTRR